MARGAAEEMPQLPRRRPALGPDCFPHLSLLPRSLYLSVPNEFFGCQEGPMTEGKREWRGKRMTEHIAWRALFAVTIAMAFCKCFCGRERDARARNKWQPGRPGIDGVALRALRIGKSVRRARANGNAPHNLHNPSADGKTSDHTPRCSCCDGRGGCTSGSACARLSDDDPPPLVPPRRRTRSSRISSAPRLAMKFGILKTVLVFAALVGRAWATTPGAACHPVELGSLKRSWNMLTSQSRDGLGPPIHEGPPQTQRDARDGRQGSGEGADRERGTTVIISGNIHALGPRIGEISKWEADVLLLQETKLAAHVIKDASAVAREAGWTLIHGRPCSPGTRMSHKDGPRVLTKMTEANSGGVAAMVRKPRRDLGLEFTQDEAALHATGK